ncbi:hypothetical protein B0F90DRAFT_1649530, partial [Multifurca ochricompacta]
ITTNNKTQQHRFYVASIGMDDMILGYPWFAANNPQIDWTEGCLTEDIYFDLPSEHVTARSLLCLGSFKSSPFKIWSACKVKTVKDKSVQGVRVNHRGRDQGSRSRLSKQVNSRCQSKPQRAAVRVQGPHKIRRARVQEASRSSGNRPCWRFWGEGFLSCSLGSSRGFLVKNSRPVLDTREQT